MGFCSWYIYIYIFFFTLPLRPGDGCLDKPLATLWKNYCQSSRPDVSMRLSVCSSGLQVSHPFDATSLMTCRWNSDAVFRLPSIGRRIDDRSKGPGRLSGARLRDEQSPTVSSFRFVPTPAPLPFDRRTATERGTSSFAKKTNKQNGTKIGRWHEKHRRAAARAFPTQFGR